MICRGSQRRHKLYAPSSSNGRHSFLSCGQMCRHPRRPNLPFRRGIRHVPPRVPRDLAKVSPLDCLSCLLWWCAEWWPSIFDPVWWHCTRRRGSPGNQPRTREAATTRSQRVLLPNRVVKHPARRHCLSNIRHPSPVLRGNGCACFTDFFLKGLLVAVIAPTGNLISFCYHGTRFSSLHLCCYDLYVCLKFDNFTLCAYVKLDSSPSFSLPPS
jgi:hypothetical protein